MIEDSRHKRQTPIKADSLINISNLTLLGEGIEASVYALDDTRVLRIYKPNSDVTKAHLTQLQQFYKSLDEGRVIFAIPDVISVGEDDGRFYTIDRRIYGMNFDKALGRLNGADRKRVLLGYINTAEQIQKLLPPFDFYGELLAKNPLREKDWATYIRNKMTSDYQKAKDIFDAAIPDVQKVLDFIEDEVDLVADTKQSKLVHGDYYISNVLVNETQDICGVMDFNNLTLAGDPRMDLASSLIFFFEGNGNAKSTDGKFLLDHLAVKYGKNMHRIVHLYRLYYAIHFASYCKDNDPDTYAWSIRSLQEHINNNYKY